MKKYCLQCKNDVDQSFDYCPYCGNKNLTNTKLSKKYNYVNKTNSYYGNENGTLSKQHEGLKKASFIMGIFSLFGGGFITAIIGLIFGIVYKKNTNKSCIGTWINGLVIFMYVALIGIVIFLFTSGTIQYDEDIESKEDVKYVLIGDQNYGYINVPDSWINLGNDNIDTISYYGMDDNEEYYTISLSYFYDNELILSEYLETVKTSLNDSDILISDVHEEFVDGNFAYRINGYYMGVNDYISVWIFKDSEGRVHYITIEGPSANSECFDLINSFES